MFFFPVLKNAFQFLLLTTTKYKPLVKVGSACTQSCLTLSNPMDCSPPGSSVHGVLQARILEWVPCSPPGDLANPGIEPKSLMSPALAGGFFTTIATQEATWHHPPVQTHRSYVKTKTLGFPCGPVVKILPCNAGDTLNPWSGTIPQAKGQLSL